MIIKGKIVFFRGAPESIPNNSTLTVKFLDTTRTCVAPIVLATSVKNIQDYKKGTDLFYEIVSDKWPRYRNEVCTLSVIFIFIIFILLLIFFCAFSHMSHNVGEKFLVMLLHYN